MIQLKEARGDYTSGVTRKELMLDITVLFVDIDRC